MSTRHTEENLMVLMILMICTFGLYAFVWLGRTSKGFGDDPVTSVVMAIMSFGLWNLVLLLRYLDMAERLNGRSLAWYNACLILLAPPLIGPLLVQLNINEHLARE